MIPSRNSAGQRRNSVIGAGRNFIFQAMDRNRNLASNFDEISDKEGIQAKDQARSHHPATSMRFSRSYSDHTPSFNTNLTNLINLEVVTKDCDIMAESNYERSVCIFGNARREGL